MIEVKKGPEPEGLKKLREECMEGRLSPKESFGLLQNPLKQQVLELKNMEDVEEDHLHTYCVDLLEAFTNEQDPKTPYVGILIWYLRSMAEAIE